MTVTDVISKALSRAHIPSCCLLILIPWMAWGRPKSDLRILILGIRMVLFTQLTTEMLCVCMFGHRAKHDCYNLNSGRVWGAVVINLEPSDPLCWELVSFRMSISGPCHWHVVVRICHTLGEFSLLQGPLNGHSHLQRWIVGVSWNPVHPPTAYFSK